MDKLTEIRLRKFIDENYYDDNFPNFYNDNGNPTTNLNEINEIFLEGTNFTEIPDEIFYFVNLKKLHLYLPIKKLDERLTEMDSLKKITIHTDCKNDSIIQKLENKGIKVKIFNYG